MKEGTTLLAVAVGDRGVVDPSEPVLRADDEALLRGRAAFETIRVYSGRPFKLAQHLDRRAGAAARVGLPAVARRAGGEQAQQARDAPAAPHPVRRHDRTPTPDALALGCELADHTGRDIAVGAIYTALARLERRGLVQSWLGEPTPERGGKAKRHYRVLAAGKKALAKAEAALTALSRAAGDHLGGT